MTTSPHIRMCVMTRNKRSNAEPRSLWQRVLAGERLPKRLSRHPKCEGTVEDHRGIALDVRELIRHRVRRAASLSKSGAGPPRPPRCADGAPGLKAWDTSGRSGGPAAGAGGLQTLRAKSSLSSRTAGGGVGSAGWLQCRSKRSA